MTMRKITALGMIVGAFAVTGAAHAAMPGRAAAQQPLFWTIPLGGLLPAPADIRIPVRWTHCTSAYCVGTLGKVQGHGYKWLVGREPVRQLWRGARHSGRTPRAAHPVNAR